MLNDISFQKGRLLGVGTFGKVYEAINLLSGEIIAVKQIELRSKRAEETAKAVEQEIKMMEGLRHPNIVKLLGFNVSAPTPPAPLPPPSPPTHSLTPGPLCVVRTV